MLVDSELMKVLDHYYGGPAFSGHSVFRLGLHVGGAPPDLSTGAGFEEPLDLSYFRVTVDQNFWSAAHIASSGPHQGRVVKTNADAVSFPSPSEEWGVPTHVGLFLEHQDEFPVGIAVMPTGLPVIEAATLPRFAPGSLSLVAWRT